MAKRKKHHHEEHVDETWLIPYADMLTLLLALFIILFASSSIDVDKFQRLAESLSQALHGGVGVMEHSTPIPSQHPVVDDRPPNEDEDEPHEDVGEDELTPEELDLIELRELQEKLEQHIAAKNLQYSLQTTLTQDGLLITIMDGALFDPGSAQIKEESLELAYAISNLLVTDPPRHITIGGHTDNVPMNTAQFPSNWHLSSGRALNFMLLLLENEQLDPRRLSASGYGEYRPVASNDTAEGRSKNRRVEVLILPNIRVNQ